MITIANLPDGKIQLSILKDEGWIRHVFESEEQMEKYAAKCIGIEYE